MTDEKKTPAVPAPPLDRGWIVAVCVVVVSAACVLIFAPEHSIESVGKWIDRLPAVGQLAILIGAVASAVAMLRNSRKGPPGGPPSVPPAVLALLAAIAIGGATSGCGASPYDVARTTLATGARVMAAVDRDLATQRVATAETIAADTASTRDEFRAALAPFDEALAVTLDTRESMLATQAGIDAAERGEASDWMGMLGCAALGVSRLVALADRRGLRLPDDVRPLVETLLGLGATACPAGDAR